MLKFEIISGSLKITDGANTLLLIAKKDVSTSILKLYLPIPVIELYNLNQGSSFIIFNQPLSRCEDSLGVPFTVDSFIVFAEENLGFTNSGTPQNIIVVSDYNALPDPATVAGEFFWCENTVDSFPVGLYYSNGVNYQYDYSPNIKVVANYSALPNPTTVSGEFYWCENSQGTKYLPFSIGGTYYNAGMYYSNGVSWSFMECPYQSTQAQVDAGTNDNTFVTPLTFNNASKWATKQDTITAGTTAQYWRGDKTFQDLNPAVLASNLTNFDATQGVVTSSDTILTGLEKISANALDVSSTGVYYFGGLSINTPTTFNVGAVKGFIVDNTTNLAHPTTIEINYAGATGLSDPNLTTSTETYVLLNALGNLFLQTTLPNSQERRQNIFLGKLGHPDKTVFANAFSQPDVLLSPLSQLRDVWTPINLVNSGVYPSPNGVNLSFNISAGTLYGLGIGFVNNPLTPSIYNISAQAPTTFRYRTQTGGNNINVTLINPTVYDVSGTITAISGGGGKATNQRIYALQNGQIRVQYGQTVYANLTDAIAGVQTESFTIFSNFINNAILIGILSVTKSCTDLSDTTKSKFLLVSKFGESVGSAGGISTTNLQQAYDNSVQPEITTNATLGAVSMKQGSGLDTNNVLEIQNGAGVNKFVITGNGIFHDDYQRVNGGNANYSITEDDQLIYTGTAFTASRTWTLPTANLTLEKREKIVADMLQTVTSTNTLVIGVQVGEYLNGVLNGTEIIQSAGGWRRLISDGTNSWTFDNGIVRVSKTQTLSNKTIESPVLTGLVTVTGTTQTVNSAIGAIDISQTWNTSGAPSLIKGYVTNSASGTNSYLIDLGIGVQAYFQVRKDGQVGVVSISNFVGATLAITGSQSSAKNIISNAVPFTNTSGTANQNIVNGSYIASSGTGVYNAFYDNSTINQTSTASGITRSFYADPILTASIDYRAFESTQGKVILTDTLLANSGALNGTLMSLSQTWNTTLNPITLKINVINTASRYDATPFQFQVSGTPRFTVSKDGYLVFGTPASSPTVATGNATSIGSSIGGKAISLLHYLTTEIGYGVWGGALTSTRTATSGDCGMFKTAETFNPTSGTATYSSMSLATIINQTSTASGVTRGLYINPTLTSAVDYRAIEITAGKLVYPSTITPVGTTGAQTINKISGKVNAGAGTTSLVVTNSLVTASSIVMCQVGTNDATARITAVVEASGSFTIYYVAPTAETVIKFQVIN